MDEIFVINLGNNNVAVAVPDNNKGGQEFKSTFNGLVCESEYERFSYLMGTDAYGEANKENDFLYLSIKDGKRERVYPLCYRLRTTSSYEIGTWLFVHAIT